MALTCKWVKDQNGTLVMKWMVDEILMMTPHAEAHRGFQIRETMSTAPRPGPRRHAPSMAHA